MKKTTTLTLSNLLLQSTSFTGNKKNAFQLKKVLLTVIGVIVMSFSSVFAQNIFNATTGNWNTAANWSLNHVPNGTENLVIPAGTSCTMDVSYSGGNAFTLTIGGTLSVPSGITLNQTKDTVIMNANGATLSGGGSVDLYTFNIATANATDVVNITNSSASAPISIGLGGASGTVNFTKGLLKLTGQTLAIAKTATINGNGGNFANSADGAGDADADGGTLALIGNSGGTTTVNGSVTFYNVNESGGNVVLDLKTATSTINGTAALVSQQGKLGNTNSPIWGASSTLSIDYTSGFNYTPGKEWVPVTGSQTATTPGYPNNVLLSNTGTSGGGLGNGNGWVPGSGDYSIRGVLTLGDNSTNAQIDFSKLSNFSCGGFVLNTGSRFSAPTTMTVNGNWTDNQAFAGSISNPTAGFINFTNSSNTRLYFGTVIFGGAGTCTTPNTIKAPSANSEAFNNLTINNGAYVALNSPVTVATTGILTLDSGIFKTTSANTLAVLNTSASAVVGGRTNIYIDGPLVWSLAASTNNYIFPVGAGGCTNTYLPLTLNKTAVTANTATVQAFNVGSNGTTDGTLSSLSPTEYWTVSSSLAITGGYDASVSRPTPVTPFIYIADSIGGVPNHFTSLTGTASGNSVTNSNPIGSGSTFYIALGAAPIVSTLAATSITTTSATLNGAFNTQNTSLTTSFNYGTTTSYGTSAITIHSPMLTNSSVPDSAIITGLTANTLYNFIATDGANTGSNVTFITAPNPPTVGAGSGVSTSAFTANWTAPAITGTAAYTYTVQASTDPTFATGVITQSGIAPGTTSYQFTGLTSATAYYYRVQTVNSYASSVWSATSAPVTTNLAASPACTNNTGQDAATTYTNQAPVIDGDIDQVWANAPSNPINNVTLGTNNNTQSWKSLWTQDSLYLLVQVTDASLISQNTGLQGGVAVAGATPNTSNNYYEADGIEFYLNPDASTGNTYDGVNDVQLRFNLGSTTISGQSAGGATQFVGAAFLRDTAIVDWTMKIVPGGYVLEAAMAWGKNNANPGVFLLPGGTYGTPQSGHNIGIDVNVNDQDVVGAGRQAQIQWFNSNTNAYSDPSQFSVSGLQVCPTPPAVSHPTKTSITATGANLGATVDSSGTDALLNPSPLASRGTAFSTTLPVSTNVMAEGGTSVGAYSSTRTGLAPQTKYYYVGYANNNAGLTGISGVDSFYTLSALPTVQPTLLSANCSGITLNWSTVAFPAADSATQTGYIILRRQDGTNPTATGINTRVAVTQGALPAGTTLLPIITSGATHSYIDATAASGTTYNYLLIPYSWDGTATDSTYNYATEEAPSISASIGTLTVPTFTAVPAICSGNDLAALPTTSNNNITGSWTPALNNTATTTYTFTPNSGQCASPTTLTITVNNGSITPTFTAVAPVCSGADVASLPTTSNNNITGSWSPAINSAATTTYTFTPNAGQCGTTTTLVIAVTRTPDITVTATPTSVTSGSQVTLVGTSTVPGASYTWSSSPIGFSSTDSATVANPTQTTTYNLTVVSGTCPPQSGSATVTINTSPCLVQPFKFFSPNGDGINDIWKLNSGDCNYPAIVSVYNRWGGLVFHSDVYDNTSHTAGFDGTYKGSPLPDGTYYYVVQVIVPGNAYASILTGNVTIVR